MSNMMCRKDALRLQFGQHSLDCRLGPQRRSESIEETPKSGGDQLCASFVLSSPCSTFALQATLVLLRVVPEFVRQDVTDHEASQRIPRP